jgi:Ca2+-binding RTX toxin-like protein
VPAESHEGAVGGQLLGAVGSALGLSAVINASLTGILGFLIPGLGSFFGTIVGTMLGDAIAGDPAYPKATHDVEILGSDTHFQNRLVGTDDHGNAAISKEMGDQVTAIANSYLDAVHGAAIGYSGKVMIGYNAGAAPYQYITGWFPNGTEVTPHFAQATDAIQEGVRELLVNTEVIGGDLLLKRAHQAFMNGPHPAPTEVSPDFSDLLSLSANLSVAQDYENYLNNREAINALIAANPNSAFAVGWIATFARVNDLGLNQMHGSDFLGGLVGYLDSIAKAGLGAEAANATAGRGAGNSVLVEVKVANGAEVPGALSVFADQMNITSDASGQTLHFYVDSGIVAGGEHFLAAGASAGDGGNDFWIGGNGSVSFTGTGGHDVLVGGAGNDNIWGGAGFDFIDGGAASDYLIGEGGNDILRGGPGIDFLFGGVGDDTYVHDRGDGGDTVLDDYTLTTDTSHWKDEWRDDDGDGINEFHHDWIVETTTDHPNAGKDSLVFGPGIAVSDIAVQLVLAADGVNQNLIVGIRDPAHPGVPFEQLSDTITLTSRNRRAMARSRIRGRGRTAQNGRMPVWPCIHKRFA